MRRVGASCCSTNRGSCCPRLTPAHILNLSPARALQPPRIQHLRTQYFVAKESGQRGAGEGCWAKKNIPTGTAFQLDICRKLENDGEADALEADGAYFVPFSFGADDHPSTRVLCDGELTTLARVREFLLPDALCDPAVVALLAPDQLLNKANDLSYTPGMLPDAYENVVQSRKANAGAFVLEIQEGSVTSSIVLITRDVTAGEELGIGYGYSFWRKHAEMARYLASLSDCEVREMKNLLSSHFS